MISESPSSDKSDQDEERSSSSLLSILDDKNKLIASLQEQLKNQKLQLKYYLDEKLKEGNLKKYSRTCLADAGDDNIAVNMEITNFYRKNGVPSKIKTMYDSMTFTENKIRSLMKLQEKVLKMILSKISKQEEPKCLSPDYLRKYPGQFSLFYSMYQINTQLYKELKCFRSSCNRLINIEEERNSIAEEICSLPSDEKCERRSIMLLCDEKMMLLTEVKELQGEKERLLEHNKQLEEGYEYTYENLNEMLEAVNEEAANLLQSSLQQKQVFQNDLNILREENESLRVKLRKMMTIVQSKQELDVKIKKMEDVCMNSIKENLYIQKKQKQKWKKDVRLIKKKLESVTLERDSLRRRLCKVKEKAEAQIKEECLNQIKKIATDRDSYKEKYDGLTYLGEAYNEVIEQNMLLKEIETAKESKICDLKESYNNLSLQMKKQNEISEFLQKQIKTLLLIIYLFGKNVPGVAKEKGDNILINKEEFPLKCATVPDNELGLWPEGIPVQRPQVYVGITNNNSPIAQPQQFLESPFKCPKVADNELGLWPESTPLQRSQVYVAITNNNSPTAQPQKFLAFPEVAQEIKKIEPNFYNKNKTVKSTPALEKLQQIISQYGDLMQKTREVKSEPKTFEINSTVSSNTLHSEVSRAQECLLPESRTHSETKHFNSETTTTLDSQKETPKPVEIKESELMKDCSNESLQQYYQFTNRRIGCTQISKESQMKFLQKSSKETSTVGFLANTINIQIKPDLVDKTTSHSRGVIQVDRAISSSGCQREVATEISEAIKFKVETQASLPEFGGESSAEEVETTIFLGGDSELPKTPLEALLEGETFPTHILQISESELVYRLQNMSTKLDQTLSNCQSNETCLINNIRSVFQALFSSNSVYANN